MATGAELKARLEAFIAELKASKNVAKDRWQAERDRLDAQIASAEAVLASWSPAIDNLVETLEAAGIPIK